LFTMPLFAAIFVAQEVAPTTKPPAPCLVVSNISTVIAPEADYEYVDTTLERTKMKTTYKGEELQRLQKDGVRVVVIEKGRWISCFAVNNGDKVAAK